MFIFFITVYVLLYIINYLLLYLFIIAPTVCYNNMHVYYVCYMHLLFCANVHFIINVYLILCVTVSLFNIINYLELLIFCY